MERGGGERNGACDVRQASSDALKSPPCALMGPMAPPGPSWAEPEWAPLLSWALIGWALIGPPGPSCVHPLGPCGPGPCGSPWALVPPPWALVGQGWIHMKLNHFSIKNQLKNALKSSRPDIYEIL